jgi:uncharacterized protein YaaR (DUF327 family)
MERKIKVYGNEGRGKELKELLTKREDYVAAGNPTKNLDELLDGYSDLMFSPKKSLLIKYYSDTPSSKLSEEQNKDFAKLLDEETEFKHISIVNNMISDIKAELGKGKNLRRVKITKTHKNGRNHQTIEMKYIPQVLNNLLSNPLDCSVNMIPASIVRGRVRFEQAPETKRDIVVVEVVSLLFDEFTNAITSHLWTVFYEIFEDNNAIEIEDFEDDYIL